MHGGADRWGFEGRRGGDDGGGDLPQARHLRPDLLPLEVEVRRPGRERGAAAAASASLGSIHFRDGESAQTEEAPERGRFQTSGLGDEPDAAEAPLPVDGLGVPA